MPETADPTPTRKRRRPVRDPDASGESAAEAWAQLEAYAAEVARRAAEPSDPAADLAIRLIEWRARDWYAARAQRPLTNADQVKLSEAQAEQIVYVFKTVFAGLALSPEQDYRARALASEALRQVADESAIWPGWDGR